VQVLALAVYKDQARHPKTSQMEGGLREAAQHTDTVPVQPGVSDGGLARATLSYLAESPDLGREASPTCALGPAQQVGCRAVEVPRPTSTLGPAVGMPDPAAARSPRLYIRIA
jgi:hypothetical protein